MGMVRGIFSSSKKLLFLLALAGLGLLVSTPAVLAQRGLNFYTDYPAVVVAEGKELSLEVKLVNTGLRTEDVSLSIEGPEGWSARFETTSYPTIQVKAVSLRPGEDEEDIVTVKFKAKPPEGAPSGDYLFTLKAQNQDGSIAREIAVTVSLEAEAPEEAEPGEEGLELTMNYPALENAAGEDFEFEIQINNKADKEQVVELGAQAPLGWRAYFMPRYESQRISSIKVGANATETIKFVITPPFGVAEEEYPLVFVTQVGETQQTLDLKAVVTGTTELNLGTEAEVTGTGDTRNVRATEGRERRFTLYLWNKGSVALNDVSFFASKPEGWEVTFEPERLDTLKPLMETRKPEAVDVIIKPRSRAIPGDYQVTLTTAGQEEREQMQLRVTVGASMGWGWVGVGVVVFVVAALTGVFVRLGRR